MDYSWTKEEQLANSLVPIGYSSTPHYSDPRCLIDGRFAMVGA